MVSKRLVHSLVLCLGFSSFVGCAEDAEQTEVSVASVGLALTSCSDNAGKWTHLADLAVAVAREMGEFNTGRQFTVVSNNGVEKVALSTYGQAECAAAGGCPTVKAMLELQDWPNNEYVEQSVFNVVDFRNSLVAMYRQQVRQVAQYAANSRFDLMPEDHSLNYLGQEGISTCGNPWVAFRANRNFHLAWSNRGAIPGMTCLSINEPSDPDSWSDNFLCSDRDLGLKWSSSGAIAGMSCVNVNEPTDPHGWSNNYLCAPEARGLSWSSDGAIAGKECLAMNEPSDLHSWNDNYLCWDPNANLLHPATLCEEFWMYGGAVSCGGNNPYIDFAVSGDGARIKLDPTDYNSSGINTSCTAKCSTVVPYYHVGPIKCNCCYYKGYGTYAPMSSKAHWWYCKTW